MAITCILLLAYFIFDRQVMSKPEMFWMLAGWSLRAELPGTWFFFRQFCPFWEHILIMPESQRLFFGWLLKGSAPLTKHITKWMWQGQDSLLFLWNAAAATCGWTQTWVDPGFTKGLFQCCEDGVKTSRRGDAEAIVSVLVLKACEIKTRIWITIPRAVSTLTQQPELIHSY